MGFGRLVEEKDDVVVLHPHHNGLTGLEGQPGEGREVDASHLGGGGV